jgi:dienelactone hydrolase
VRCCTVGAGWQAAWIRRVPGLEVVVVEVVVFHHALGVTPGVLAFAETLRASGHVVHVPDLYEGQVFSELPAGVAHAQSVGFGELIGRGVTAAGSLPAEVVYLGMSLGVLAAQQLAQTRAGARGAVLLYSFVPPTEFSEGWPGGVPVQIHGMDADPYFAGDGDIDAARAFMADASDAELFVYPGDGHLFADPSSPDFDPEAAALLTERVLRLLADLR